MKARDELGPFPVCEFHKLPTGPTMGDKGAPRRERGAVAPNAWALSSGRP